MQLRLILRALERQAEATETAAQASRDLEEADGLLADSFGKLSGQMGGAASKLAKFTKGLGPLGKVMEGVADVTKEITSLSWNHAMAMDAATNSMRAQTGASASVARAMQSVIDATIKYGVTAKDVEKATTELYSTFSDFYGAGQAMQESLIKDAVILEQVGMSFRSFADIMQVGVKLLGKTQREAADSAYQLRAAAQAIGMPIDEFARKVVPLTENLANMGDTAMQAAMSVVRLSRETGISTDSLTGLDDQMSTFEGATRFAQRMNQALGGVNAFDPHELMQAYNSPDGPLAVARLVKKEIDASGTVLKDLNRYQLNFMQTASQMSGADLLRLQNNDISEDLMKMPSAIQARAEAEQDALINMKSTAEYTENMKKALLTMPMAPVV